MSGPKVIRVVTREEIKAMCERNISEAEAALQRLLKVIDKLNVENDNPKVNYLDKIETLKSLLEADKLKDIRKLAPNIISFLNNEFERIQKDAASAAASLISKRHQLMDSAASIIAAFKAIGEAPPAYILDISYRALEADHDAIKRINSELNSAFGELAAKSNKKSIDTSISEFSDRLNEGLNGQAFSEWLSSRRENLQTSENHRINLLLAEIAIKAPQDIVKKFTDRLFHISINNSKEEKNLLIDSLILDLSNEIKNINSIENTIKLLLTCQARLKTISSTEAQNHLNILSQKIQNKDVSSADILIKKTEEIIQKSDSETGALGRRKAILSGLAELGYEVRSTMNTMWVESGRLVVKKPGKNDYGVELSAPEDMSRLQIRLVGSEASQTTRNQARDIDEETIWCGDFKRLNELMRASGNQIEIEKAIEVGAQKVKTVRFEENTQETLEDRKISPLNKFVK